MHSTRQLRLAILPLVLVTCALAQKQELNTAWDFLPDKSDRLTVTQLKYAQGWRQARADVSWNAQFDDLRDYMGVAWYRRGVEIPELAGRRVLLGFGAVDYHSEVFVNGKSVGTHEGGYTPFSFDITGALKSGQNEIAIRVIDPPMNEAENRKRFPEMMYREIPHGKQHWYVQTGGMWQGAWLDIRPATYIERVQVTPDVSGKFSVRVRLGGNDAATTGTLVIQDPAGRQVVKALLTAAGRELKHEGAISNPKLWSLDEPNLYRIEVRLANGDSMHDHFGFRSFEARDGKFFLNGKPFYMIGALDQDFYPDTIYTAPSVEYLRDMMVKSKQLGLNLLRCHIKVCQPEYMRVADEVGILVWYEIPSWNDENHFTPKAAERGERIYAAMTERDWNHPSIVIQSVINESWGADLKQADQRTWLRAAFERAKALVAPLKRLVVDNSACCNNFHVKTDIDDFHQYFSIPDNAHRWDKWVADFASRPKWSFSPHGDAERTGREPLVVSEFGNWGLPQLPAKLPWWFDRAFGGRDVTRPGGVHQRFQDFGFGRHFRDFNELALATQHHQFRSLKHEIEEMRRHASIQGYVITELTDINWEVNGLMDMWRNPKVYARELAQLQQPDLVFTRPQRHNYRAGEEIVLPVFVSHYGTANLTRSAVKWSSTSGESGSLPIPAMQSGSAVEIGAIRFKAPQSKQGLIVQVSVEIRDGAGKAISSNSHRLFVYPSKTVTPHGVALHDPAGGARALAEALGAAGYKVSPAPANDRLLIATRMDDLVRGHLARGGRALLVLNDKQDLVGTVKVVPRAGSDLDGNWVTNFNWIDRTSAAFAGLPSSSALLGFEGAAVVPEFVIDGVPAASYSDVLSGIFYGWLNNNRALAVQFQSGKGRAVATTFRFDAYGKDPYATALLDNLVEYIVSPRFTPQFAPAPAAATAAAQ